MYAGHPRLAGTRDGLMVRVAQSRMASILRASMILKSGGPVGIRNSPIPQAIYKVVGHACCPKLFRSSPHFTAADITVMRAWSVVRLQGWKWKILCHGVLQVLFHPCPEQRFRQCAAHLEGKGLENGLPAGTDHNPWVNALVGTPTAEIVVGTETRVCGLKTFRYGDKQTDRLRLTCLKI